MTSDTFAPKKMDMPTSADATMIKGIFFFGNKSPDFIPLNMLRSTRTPSANTAVQPIMKHSKNTHCLSQTFAIFATCY